MKKYGFIILALILSCKNTNKLVNGFTKPVKKTTVYVREIVENKVADTLIKFESNFNTLNQLTQYQSHYFKDNIKNNKLLTYDSENRLIQEKMFGKNDDTPSIINYFYKGNLLDKTVQDTRDTNTVFKIVEKYNYNLSEKLETKKVSILYINTVAKDTIVNTLEVYTYNSDKVFENSVLTNFKYPEERSAIKYKYNSYNLPIEYKEYDSTNKLLSKTSYKYKNDKFNNWVKREGYINDSLSYVRTRIIEYRN